MAYFALFFALLCFQISTGEGLPQSEILLIEKENHVSSEFEGASEEKKSAELEWTEDDEKWFQNIQDLLAEDSDEDYHAREYEFGKLVQQIEELMSEHHPEKGNYQWLLDIAMWFYDDEEYSDESHDFSDWNREKKVEIARSRPQLQKRFSSV